ncbi:MAG: lipocalin family protein [Pedobacter sp.]|uniref:lipocalin family protein n=1 Tax=Pedobacter sp. TaxID=1411316 RepID=UPI00280914E0|nr:lipocalin family protein [Pedobacter sp.]MDQ8003678.1 lipocalin family protein [Pedobacter sp.]
MKKLIYLLISASILLNSCAKDTYYIPAPDINETGGGASSKALENTKWKLTAETSLIEGDGPNYTRNDFLEYDECELDDIVIYKPNSIVAMDQGAEKCFSSDPQLADVGTWTLSADQKTLTIKGTDGNVFDLTFKATVLQLDATTLKYQYFYIINNVKTTTTSTYTKVN